MNIPKQAWAMALVLPISLKLAFLYADDAQAFQFGQTLRPTYRVSWRVYPTVRRPKFTAGVSSESKVGDIKPLAVLTVSGGSASPTPLAWRQPHSVEAVPLSPAVAPARLSFRFAPPLEAPVTAQGFTWSAPDGTPLAGSGIRF
jgi:hypothetical protein